MAEIDQVINEPSDAEKRIKDLSSKVKTASEERDAEKARADAEAAKALDATRERDFYSGFSDVVGNNPAAKDHKDEIKAKVLSGYTVEDATYAVLGKAGKLSQPAPVVEKTQVGGGSATNGALQAGQKGVAEMTQEERRQAITENFQWS
jgi:hypothetical protein